MFSLVQSVKINVIYYFTVPSNNEMVRAVETRFNQHTNSGKKSIPREQINQNIMELKLQTRFY